MDIAVYVIRSICAAVTDPVWVLVFVLLAVFLYRGNRKTSLMQRMIMGESVDSAMELTLSQIVIGIIAGTIASLILSYLGVMFNENSSIIFLFLISIVLMFFNPRLVCFAYSGGVLGVVSLSAELVYKLSGGILKYSDVSFLITDITAMMTLVAVLHLIEGFLVIIDGDRGYIPVFSNRDDKIAGGFAFQRYWVLPVAIFIIMSKSSIASASDLVKFNTPGWWPFINVPLSKAALALATLGMMPLMGMVGYSSMTFTRDRKEKKRLSGLFIIAYSLVLFTLAQLAALNVVFKVLAVIFAPAGHEGMILYQRYLEAKRAAKYVNGEEGVMILDVVPNSPASEVGVKSGDTVLEVNNKKIENEQDIFEYVYEHSNFAWLKIRNADGTIKEVNFNHINESKRLGMVFIPKIIPDDNTVIKVNGLKFGDVLERLKKNNDDKNDPYNPNNHKQ